MTKNTSTQRFSFGVFLTAFLIGGAFVYYATPLIPSEYVRHDNRSPIGHNKENDSAIPHDHENESELGHDHENESELGHDHEHEHESELGHDHEHEHESELDHDHDHENELNHNHDHEHDENHALALDIQALANIGIEPGEAGMITLVPSEFSKKFSFPGFVRYKPGRSLVDVPTPASGVITKIYAEEGEALCPGEPLFEIQLTHEELTSCQLDLLSLLQKRDLLESENERLSRLAAGTEPKTQREIELQIKENAAAIESQKQALRFLGVSEQTLEETIVKQRNLLTTLTVRVPELVENNSRVVLESADVHANRAKDHFKQIEHYQQLEKIFVEKGQTVSLGDSLGVVSDLRELWIEGKAFESDESLINKAYSQRKKISAVFENAQDSSSSDVVDNLSIRSVSNRLDSTARTFACYVDLKNYVLNPPEELIDERDQEDAPSTAKAPLLNWRFKPGQRCELEIETETLSNVFVLPVSAVAQDGNEAILFEYIGDEDEKPIWHKRPVVVLYQTTRNVVVANDGSVKEGAKIAKRGAYQLYVALNNGGGKLQSACPCGDHDH